jgi:hypothetical protein
LKGGREHHVINPMFRFESCVYKAQEEYNNVIGKFPI